MVISTKINTKKSRLKVKWAVEIIIFNGILRYNKNRGNQNKILKYTFWDRCFGRCRFFQKLTAFHYGLAYFAYLYSKKLVKLNKNYT